MTSIETSVFGKTVQKAHAWLEDLRVELGAASDAEAYRALRATLPALRDALTVHEVGDLSAQLPMLFRGLFLEGWRPTAPRQRVRDLRWFLAAVQARYGGQHVDAHRVATGVFKVLADHVTAGEIGRVKQALPHALRVLWPGEAASVPPAAERCALGHVVGQYMSRGVLTASADAPLQDALETMAAASIRHLLVLAPDEVGRAPIRQRAVVGMLSDRDALHVMRRHPDEDVRLEWLLVRDVMTHTPLATLGPTADLSEAASLMHAQTISALPIVEEEVVIGIVTSDDLMYAFSREFASAPPWGPRKG